MQETRVRSLDWEGPLEKGMATHSAVLAWRTPWTEEPGRLQSIWSQRVRHDLATNKTIFLCVRQTRPMKTKEPDENLNNRLGLLLTLCLFRSQEF